MAFRETGNRFPCAIYLFGSCARGEDTEQSDIDLLVIAEEEHQVILAALENQKKKIKGLKHLRLSIHCFRSLEWAQMARKDAAFYERVERDKIQIV